MRSASLVLSTCSQNTSNLSFTCTFPSTLSASVHKPPRPHHHRHHRRQSPNSPASARSQSEKEEGVPSWTDVEIAAAHRGIIMLSVRPFECLRDAAQWQWEDLGERENFSPLCWCFFVFFLIINLQAGDPSGHRVLGSADPGAAVWFGWLGTLWVLCPLIFFRSWFLPFHPPLFARYSA